MSGSNLEGLFKEIKRTVKRRHAHVHESCKAKMGDEYGYLGYSSFTWSKVWFDTKDEGRTLHNNLSKAKAKKLYHELKRKYGV